MELIKNLRYMCRICAVNIKKRRSSSSAVSILETTQLTEKLKKYLNIDINSNDVLPKSICSVCYKKVEAIHALAALAKKTENFLTDFIKIAQNNLKQQVQPENFQTIFNQNDEFNQFALLDNNDCINDNDIICCEDDQRSSEPEEVVLNFTLNDPLTKNIQKKIVVAKQKKQQQNLLNQRQQEQQREHQKFQHDLSQYSTSITPTIQYKNNTDNTNDVIQEYQVLNNNNNKRNELNNTSLEQKRQNLKMILNNNTTTNSTIHQQQQIIQQHQQKHISPETSINSCKLMLPHSGIGGINSNINQTGINVAVQIQEQSPTIYSPNQKYSELIQQQTNLFINNNRAVQMMNDCLNLGSVIKDMDLLKLILKALKWPFNQETLNIQIQRLKSTRFRDVMLDPNLLLDTDLMQILSTYLSPNSIQTSPTQTSNISSSSLTAANILPPSVSYKIPAETSVRLVCVPREEHQQQKHNEQEKYQQQSSQATISTTSSSHSTKKHHSYNHDYKSSFEYQKTKKKHSKLTENNRHLQQQNYEPIIILSDDDDISHGDSSDNIQKFEVNVDPMLYFNGADSSYENSNESTMITMGYFKQHQQQQQPQQQNQQQGVTSLNSEVTLQKRKKQKRKQTLTQNPINKNQEILIIDENGEKPIQLNNELLCIPTKKKYNDNNMPSTSKNYNNNDDYLNIPVTSNSDKLNSDDVCNFEFTTPKKKRKLNTLKSSKSSGLFTLPKTTKTKVPHSDSMVIIHKSELSINDNKFPIQKEIKLEKNLNDVSIIAVESTKKIETTNKPIVELMPKKNINDKSLKSIDNVVNTLEKNIIKEQLISIEDNQKESLIADKVEKNTDEIIDVKQKEINKEIISEIIEEDNLKISSCSRGIGDDDADSVDTNGELVIDEGYDEEKLKDDESNKIDNNCEINIELKPIAASEEIESKLINLPITEETLINNANENISNSVENNTLRRSRRQTKFKTPIMKSVRKNTSTIKKNLVTPGATVVTNVKKTVVSTRGKTRQQEQKTKLQKRITRSNISQRGREQKPFTKYSKKKS